MDDEYASYMLSQTEPDDTAAWYGMGNYNNPVTSAESGVGLPGEEAAETEKSVRADQDVYGPAAGGTGTTGTGGVTTTATPNTNPLAGIWNTLKPLIVGDDGKVNPMGAFGIAALMSTLGLGRSSPAPVGYQGGIPRYTAVRQQVPMPVDPNRRPGSAGRRYFTDVQYVPTSSSPTDTSVQTARTAAKEQAETLKPPVTKTRDESNEEYLRKLGLWDDFTMGPPAPEKKEGSISSLMDRVKAANPGLDWSKYNPGRMTMDYDEFDQARDRYLRSLPGAVSRGNREAAMGKDLASATGLSTVLGSLRGRPTVGPVKPSTSHGDTPEDFGYTDQQFADMLLRQSTLPPPPRPVEPGVQMAAQGGLMNLARGRYLNGSTDGMADKIPANIEGKQEARLSHGEFVIPADVVSHLGNGNSEAGAQELYSMMDRIRKARTGNPKQGKQIAPSKYLPS